MCHWSNNLNQEYLGHVTPVSYSEVNIQNSIVDFLTKKHIITEKIVAATCDGTIVNSGHKGRVIRLLEEEMDRPLQWFVCQLYANEFLLKHLLEHLYEHTKGPYTHTLDPLAKVL